MRPREWVRTGLITLRHMGAWARDYRYAAAALAHGAGSWLRREDPADWQRAGADLPVVLLPGIYETWRMMRPVADALRAAGHAVHVVRPLRLNSRSVLLHTRQVVQQVRATPELAGGFAIVAHSKGGLVGKSVMLVPGVGERVRVMVTIATPFSGSSYAPLWAPGLGIRSLAPRARAVRALRERAEVNSRIVALIPGWDPHIPDDPALAGASNVRLAEEGHFAPLASPRVHRLVLAALAEQEA